MVPTCSPCAELLGKTLMPLPRAFWDDLARDLQDPEFLREYLAESARIEALDRLTGRSRKEG